MRHFVGQPSDEKASGNLVVDSVSKSVSVSFNNINDPENFIPHKIGTNFIQDTPIADISDFHVIGGANFLKTTPKANDVFSLSAIMN